MSNSSDHVGFVANPNCGRGTISLLLQCFSTIILCVYTSLHLDVRDRPLSGWKSIAWKSEAVVVCIIAPELFASFAFSQWLEASRLRAQMNAKLGSRISLQQAFFLHAGGIQIKTADGTRQLLFRELASGVGSFNLTKLEDEQCRKFWDAIMSNLLSDSALDDRNKSSSVAKIITCLQTIKTLVLIIGRFSKRFDVSLIEVATVAYIVLTLISYMFWFAKTYDIQLAEVITILGEVPEADEKNGRYENLIDRSQETPLLNSLPEVTVYEKSRQTEEDLLQSGCFIILGSLYGAIHCAAWRYAFPSVAETILWRTSCVLIAAFPCLFFGSYLALSGKYWRRMNNVRNRAALTAMFAYCVARVVLIVEIFISLRSAPRGIYEQPDWAPYLGHDGA